MESTQEHGDLLARVDDTIADLAKALGAQLINMLHTKNDTVQPKRTTYDVRTLYVTGTHAAGIWLPGDIIRVVFRGQQSQKNLWNIVKEELRLPDEFKAPANNVLSLTLPDLSAGKDVHPVVTKIARITRETQANCGFYMHYSAMGPKPADLKTSGPSTDAGLDMIADMQHLAVELGQIADSIEVEVSDPTKDPEMLAQQELFHDLQLGADPLYKKETSQGIPPDELADALSMKHLYDIDNIIETISGLVNELDLGFTDQVCYKVSIPPAFSNAYHKLRQTFTAQGLFGPELGLLGPQTLLWTIYSIYLERANHDPLPEDEQRAAGILVLEAFYSLLHAVTREGASTPEGLVLSVFTPTGRLTTRHMSREAILTLEECLKQYLSSKDGGLLRTTDGWRAYTAHCNLFLELEYEMWAQSATKQAEFRSLVASSLKRIPTLLRNFDGDEATTELVSWTWPKVMERSGRTLYVIGLFTSPSPQDGCNPPEQWANSIVDYIRESVLDPLPATEGLITISLASREEVASLLPARIPNERTTSDVVPASSTTIARGDRFRTAGQAISRLRHDPAHAGIAYDLAYEDRFDGLVWMELESWGNRASEEEDFIPEHRVRILKRRIDGCVVWDRVGRIDGTGA